jgi:hypothetical protein
MTRPNNSERERRFWIEKVEDDGLGLNFSERTFVLARLDHRAKLDDF